MDKNKNNIAVSALYTAGAWQWARLPAAELVTPKDARPVFRFVNAFLVLYRLINPRVYSLRHQMLHRHAAISHVLAASGCTRIVEVACGFSPRGAEFSADPAVDYVELDLPDMAACKRAQLEASAGGRAILARPNFQLRGGDINTLDFAAEFAGRSSALVTEGLMMYFKREQQLLLWRRIAAALRGAGGIYLFDYIPLSEEPRRSGLGRLLHSFRVRVLGIRGDFAYDERNRQGIADDLLAAGFDSVEAINTGDVAHAWSLPQADVASRTIIYRCRAGTPPAPLSKESL
jgi:O-methyltransferase involved in polyketide biosynthesis